MKTLSLVLAAAGCFVAAQVATVSSASADYHRGGFGHRCHTVKTVTRGPHGKRVDIRRVCR